MRNASTTHYSSDDDDEQDRQQTGLETHSEALCLPASLTKHLPVLVHPLPRNPSVQVTIQQASTAPPSSTASSSHLPSSISTANPPSEGDATTQDGSAVKGREQTRSTGTTGTTLWLGGQVMGCYAADVLGRGDTGKGGKRKKVIELGGGVGYLALVFASLGYDVTTTDILPSLETVLRPNIAQNCEQHWDWPPVTVKELDWFAFGDGKAWLKESSSAGAEGGREEDRDEGDEGGDREEDEGQRGFDLIVTTDTIYSLPLLSPLLSTLRSLALLSSSITTTTSLSPSTPPPSTTPPILLAIENRDPALTAKALEMAKEAGFECKRVAPARVRKAVEKTGRWGWGKEMRADWEGVEVWKWKYVKGGFQAA